MAQEEVKIKIEEGEAPQFPTWVRRYPPLVSLLVSLLIAVLILPSTLNLPQSNPSTVLEYAPVPPEDENVPPPAASGLGSLGLASTGSLFTGITPPDLEEQLLDIPPLDAQKRCIAGRQTEDPSSPPCQQFFTGDNGGTTWQGVTRDEITVLIYNQVGQSIDRNTGRREPSPAAGSYCDIDTLDCNGDGRSTGNEQHVWHRVANAYARYFNTRFQTYNRRVHFWYYWSAADTASARRGDAADNWERLKPFAVINATWWGGFPEEYADSMAFRDVMVFTGVQAAMPRSFFRTYNGKAWSNWPDVENWADLFVGYVCNKVHYNPSGGEPVVTDAGQEFIGKPRRYGLMWTSDPGLPTLRYFKDLVKAGIKQCGISQDHGNLMTEVQWPNGQFAVDNSGDQTYGVNNAAKLRDSGVNTVLWLGASDTKTSRGAAQIGYFPQWILAGDRNIDGWDLGRLQDQEVWRHAWVHSYQVRTDRGVDQPGYRAYKDAQPDGTDWAWALRFYRDFFFLFTSIQVAGPRLEPSRVDAGLHAVQRRDSTDPYVASGYFFPGDYSFVKDSIEMYYDPDTTETTDGQKGCWRMVRGPGFVEDKDRQAGYRYARDRWDTARGTGVEVPGYFDGRDLCNGYNNGFGIRAA